MQKGEKHNMVKQKFFDIRLQEVVSLMKMIQKEVLKMGKPQLTQEELEKGFGSSKLGASQPQEVAMTPLMKNALAHYGDIKSEDWRLRVDDPQTRAEDAIVSNMKLLALRYNGSTDVYNETLPLLDKRHYDVQVHQNLKDNLRDIQPGQAKQRSILAHKYTKPTTNTIEYIINLLETDIEFQKAVSIVLDILPPVKAEDEIKEINLPFMTKHTGVGYPFWQNDKTIDEKTGKSYAELTMELADSLKDKYDEWYKYNVATMYGRNQRGKGRLLIAVSRVLNLLINPLEAVEIQTYKERCPAFIGYQDDIALKEALVRMASDCEKYGLKCANRDYDTFDLTVGSGMNALVGAISIFKANGSRSKRIALMRAIFGQKSYLVDGLDRELLDILGRVFSGYIDTNRGGGIANLIMMLTGYMKQDPKYSEIVYKLIYWMIVMGDDNNGVYRICDRKQLREYMEKTFGVILKEEKYAYGPEFLQYRVFKDLTGNIVMAYAWSRVVRSMLMKEESKGLGPVGWCYAWYQQLSKLIECDEAFSIAVNLLIPFDENQFFKDTPISQLNEMLKKEDQEAYVKLKTEAQRRRFRSTLEKLYDGDPTKERMYKSMTKEDGILAQVQAKIREVYDPNFYSKHGLRW